MYLLRHGSEERLHTRPLRAAIVLSALIPLLVTSAPTPARATPVPSISAAAADTPAQVTLRKQLRARMYVMLHETYANYRAASPRISAMPADYSRRFRGVTAAASPRLTSIARRLSAARTLAQHRALYRELTRELTRSRTNASVLTLTEGLLDARGRAISAGQSATHQWLAGSMSDARYDNISQASGAVAAWAAADRVRLDAALGGVVAPAPSIAARWKTRLNGSAPVPVPAGWQPIPGACALPVADRSWIGGALAAGPHQWVTSADVTATRKRLTAASDATFLRADQDIFRLSRWLFDSPAAASSELRVRSQRLGYLSLIHNDAAAAARLAGDTATIIAAGPTGRTLTDAGALQSIVTSLDWLNLSAGQRRRLSIATRSLWLSYLTCRAGDRVGADSVNNMSVIFDSTLFQSGIYLARLDPALGAALARSGWRDLSRSLPSLSDGGWFEGPTYWNFMSFWLVGALSTAQNVYGTHGPVTVPNVAQPSHFAWNAKSNSGTLPTFADSDGSPLRTAFASLALRSATPDPVAMASIRARLNTQTQDGFEVMWWPSVANWNAAQPTKSSALYPTTGLGVLQSAEGATAWIKGSASLLNHTHLDVGSVDLFANGVNWITDPGAGDYTLPGYFVTTPTSKRWGYWQTSAAAHTSIVGELSPTVGAPAPLSMNDNVMQVDLRNTIPGATTATRSVTLAPRRMTLTDRITVKPSQSFTWRWTTEAVVDVKGDSTFLLSKAGKQLTLTLGQLPPGATVAIEQAPALSPSGAILRTITVELPRTTIVDLTATATW